MNNTPKVGQKLLGCCLCNFGEYFLRKNLYKTIKMAF